jgi:hypothetical protein
MDLRETGCEVVDWIHLAEYRDQWQALMNTVMKPSGSISWLAEWLLAFQEGFYSMELFKIVILQIKTHKRITNKTFFVEALVHSFI